jgi:hypothetical protein
MVLKNILENLFILDSANSYDLLFDSVYDFNHVLPSNFNVKVLDTTSKIKYEYILVPRILKNQKYDLYISPE